MGRVSRIDHSLGLGVDFAVAEVFVFAGEGFFLVIEASCGIAKASFGTLKALVAVVEALKEWLWIMTIQDWNLGRRPLI